MIQHGTMTAHSLPRQLSQARNQLTDQDTMSSRPYLAIPVAQTPRLGRGRMQSKLGAQQGYHRPPWPMAAAPSGPRLQIPQDRSVATARSAPRRTFGPALASLVHSYLSALLLDESLPCSDAGCGCGAMWAMQTLVAGPHRSTFQLISGTARWRSPGYATGGNNNIERVAETYSSWSVHLTASWPRSRVSLFGCKAVGLIADIRSDRSSLGAPTALRAGRARPSVSREGAC